MSSLWFSVHNMHMNVYGALHVYRKDYRFTVTFEKSFKQHTHTHANPVHAYANLIFIICIQTHSKRPRTQFSLPPQIKSNRSEIYCILWIICGVRHSSRNRALWLYHLKKKLQIPHWDIIIIIIFIIVVVAVVVAVAIVVISFTMNCVNRIRIVSIIQQNLSRFEYFV